MAEPAAEEMASSDGAVGARVRAARLRTGVTGRTLAQRIGVSPATVSQIENGRTRLSVARLEAIAQALETDAIEILAVTDRSHDPAQLRLDRHPAPSVGPGGPAESSQWRRYGPLDFDPVLAAALEEFLRAGYHGASIRDIARTSGLSVPGLYHHYASKQQMLYRILDLTMTDLLARSQAARHEGRDPVERFSLLIECLAMYHTHRRDLAFVGASEMRSLEPENRKRIAAMRTAQQRMVDQEAEEAAAAGSFTTAHPYDAARAVTMMCTGLAHWFRINGSETPEEIASQYVGFSLSLMGYRAH